MLMIVFVSHPSGNATARDALEVLARRADAPDADPSDAFSLSSLTNMAKKLSLGDVANGASLVGSGFSIIHDLFGGCVHLLYKSIDAD